VAYRSSNKLSAKFFGPFPVIAKIEAVAYRLQLPEDSKIHLVFHISQLRKHVGNRPVQSTLPAVDEVGIIAAEPLAVLDRKLGRLGNKATVYGQHGKFIHILSRGFLTLIFQLEDKFL